MVPDMQWWNDFVEWFYSEDGSRVFSTAVLPFIAILIAGILAALIGRASMKRLIVFQDRQHKAAAVTALIGAGRRAAIWSTLSAQEKEHVEHQASEAETRVRLLPVVGASVAADWTAHQISEMKRNSAIFSFQAEQNLVDFRDGLIMWLNHPNRARKLFVQDLAGWKYDDGAVDHDLVEKQQQWVDQQITSKPEIAP